MTDPDRTDGVDRMEICRRDALIGARDALHRLCLERGSTDGYAQTFAEINAALFPDPSTTRGAVSPEHPHGVLPCTCDAEGEQPTCPIHGYEAVIRSERLWVKRWEDEHGIGWLTSTNPEAERLAHEGWIEVVPASTRGAVEERERLPISAFMVSMAVCEIPTATAMEVLRLARLDDGAAPPTPWGSVDLERAGNAIAAVLCECCTVEEIEDTLAQINPEDWKLAAQKAIEVATPRGAVEPCETCASEAEERRVVGPDHRNCIGGDECPDCGARWPEALHQRGAVSDRYRVSAVDARYVVIDSERAEHHLPVARCDRLDDARLVASSLNGTGAV